MFRRLSARLKRYLQGWTHLFNSIGCASRTLPKQYTLHDVHLPLLRMHKSRFPIVACHACCTKHAYLIKQHLFMQKLTHKQLQREATQRLNEFMGQIRNQPSVDLSAKNLGEEGCSYVAEALAFNDRCTRPAHMICTYTLTTYMMGYTCFTPAGTQNVSCSSPHSEAGCSSGLLLAHYICLSMALKVGAASQQDATESAICHLYKQCGSRLAIPQCRHDALHHRRLTKTCMGCSLPSWYTVHPSSCLFSWMYLPSVPESSHKQHTLGMPKSIASISTYKLPQQLLTNHCLGNVPGRVLLPSPCSPRCLPRLSAGCFHRAVPDPQDTQ